MLLPPRGQAALLRHGLGFRLPRLSRTHRDGLMMKSMSVVLKSFGFKMDKTLYGLLHLVSEKDWQWLITDMLYALVFVRSSTKEHPALVGRRKAIWDAVLAGLETGQPACTPEEATYFLCGLTLEEARVIRKHRLPRTKTVEIGVVQPSQIHELVFGLLEKHVRLTDLEKEDVASLIENYSTKSIFNLRKKVLFNHVDTVIFLSRLLHEQHGVNSYFMETPREVLRYIYETSGLGPDISLKKPRFKKYTNKELTYILNALERSDLDAADLKQFRKQWKQFFHYVLSRKGALENHPRTVQAFIRGGIMKKRGV